MEEHELVKKCLKGDSKAQKQLFDKYAPQMMTVCNRYATRNDQALDMLQEGFIKVFDKLSQFSGSGSLAGWIRSVIVTTSLTVLRKEKKFAFSESLDENFELAEVNTDVISKMSFDEISSLIQKMPVGYRTVFNMFAIEGYSHKEIAQHLEITESTSKTQYRKSKAYLQKLIAENE